MENELGDKSFSDTATVNDPTLESLKNEIIQDVYREIQEKILTPHYQQSSFISNLVEAHAHEYENKVSSEHYKLLHDVVTQHFGGYGPIQKFIDDHRIGEIMVNGPKQVFIEREGHLIETDVTFDNDAHVLAVIHHILKPLGRFVDYEHPTVDARLPDGSRVNVVVPPVAHRGPCITIRKFLKDKLTMEQIIGLGSLTDQMAEFFHACVVSKLNVIISGNTSSGKTTLLNILSAYIPEHERIITVEDAAELNLLQRHVVSLEVKPPNPKGEGSVTVRDLVKNALRMRPDRIVVGEVRGGEALDMLQAMNTGHEGSLTTVHSNTPRDTISRLETMALMAGIDIPVRAIRHQIASAIHLIVHAMRLTDGSRKITNVCEVVGMEGDVVTLMDLFKFNQTGIDTEGRVVGEIQPTGLRPQFTSILSSYGFNLPPKIFLPNFRTRI